METGGEQGGKCEHLRTIGFNAKGFKQSHVYISKLLSNCDIIGVSETWLRPGELPMIKNTLKDENLSVFAKSSMNDIDPTYVGRPYGGIALICKKRKGLSYEEITVNSERLAGVKVCSTKGVLQIILYVYMPFYSGDYNQIELYSEVLDEIQSVINQYGALCPIYVLGDFNAQLPKKDILHRNWYKTAGYNKNSRILYEFISDNDLSVLDLLSNQGRDYTYFCHTSQRYTWIDHCLCLPNNCAQSSCYILDHDSDNVSDHLPICLETEIPISVVLRDSVQYNQGCLSLPVRWDDCVKVAAYEQIVQSKLQQLSFLESENISDSDIQLSVDDQLNRINQVLHDAATEAGCSPKRKHLPKPYWNPDLSRMRDRKRFWWKLWTDNDRPRNGIIYEIYKAIKKQFRSLSRRSANEIYRQRFNKLDNFLCTRKMSSFWNEIKCLRRTKVNSDLQPSDFGSFYQNIMADGGNRSPEQLNDQKMVHSYAAAPVNSHVTLQQITDVSISKMIEDLPGAKSPGIDGITSEHLKYSRSTRLCELLENLYCISLSRSCVPSIFNTGIIIPILKKSTLNPNMVQHYRPVTVSSIHTKLVELLLLPNVDVNDNQFGFRQGRGTSMACNLFTDIISYCKHQKSPLYVASLDAEKCFDTVCHISLFVKLIDVLPKFKWLFLYNWYNGLNAVIKWSGQYSTKFPITRGTRQGSVLSPYLFNIFINQLLEVLSSNDKGIEIGGVLYNSFAYADDVTIMCPSITGLQQLINICQNYSRRWRFNFNKEKSNCMIIGKCPFINEPKWYMDGHLLQNVQSLEILGNVYNHEGSSSDHVSHRLRKCRQSFYSLSSAGMLYPGATTTVKTYLYNHICQPTLTYGIECMNLTENDIVNLDSAQGKLIKQSLGLNKRSHNTQLLQAMNVKKARELNVKKCTSLFNRIGQVASPTRSLLLYFLSRFILYGEIIPGTLLSRVISQGQSPIKCLFSVPKMCANIQTDGHIDSIRHLLHHENFIKPYSEEHLLVHLLTIAF